MTNNRKRFLSPVELAGAAAEIGALAAREGVRIVLIGGFALQHYGSDRLTGDLDFAADAALAGLPPGKALSFGGVQTESSSGVPVDFIVRDDDYRALYEEAIDRAVKVDGLAVPLATPEYLAAMKMAAARDRDVIDLEFLLRMRAVNAAKAREIIYRHLGPYAAQEFDRVVDEVEWKRHRDEK